MGAVNFKQLHITAVSCVEFVYIINFIDFKRVLAVVIEVTLQILIEFKPSGQEVGQYKKYEYDDRLDDVQC